MQVAALYPIHLLVPANRSVPRLRNRRLPEAILGGWRAFAGSREVPIHRADYTFRAVALPAGETRVEFVYRPMSFRIGVIASVVAIVGLAIAAMRDRRRTARRALQATLAAR